MCLRERRELERENKEGPKGKDGVILKGIRKRECFRGRDVRDRHILTGRRVEMVRYTHLERYA